MYIYIFSSPPPGGGNREMFQFHMENRQWYVLMHVTSKPWLLHAVSTHNIVATFVSLNETFIYHYSIQNLGDNYF